MDSFFRHQLLKNRYMELEFIREFVKHITGLEDLGILENNIGLALALLGICSPIFRIILKTIISFNSAWKNKKLANDLSPFYHKYEIKQSLVNFIQTKCQNVSPAIMDEPSQTFAFITKEKLIPFFLNKAFKVNEKSSKYYLILAGSGMGKTTFLINLFVKFNQRLFKKYSIYLIPLGHPKCMEKISQIQNKQNSFILLDAFDEDIYAVSNYKERLQEILDRTWEFQKIVITCRTQFFPSEIEEPNKTGFFHFSGDKKEHTFAKLYISPFDDDDIRRYLRKKYSFFNYSKRKEAFRIVKKSPNLMVRPMLLNYIEDLTGVQNQYQFSFQIYDKLIHKWASREANRQKENKEFYRDQIVEFSRSIAVVFYYQRNEGKGLMIPSDKITEISKLFTINLSEMDMKNRSLLNRNAHGLYKFAHKSILEYFLVLEYFNDKEFQKIWSFKGMEAAKIFYQEMCLNILQFNLSHVKFGSGAFFVKEVTNSFQKIDMKDQTEFTVMILKNINQIVYIYFHTTNDKELITEEIIAAFPKLNNKKANEVYEFLSKESTNESLFRFQKIWMRTLPKILEKLDRN